MLDRPGAVMVRFIGGGAVLWCGCCVLAWAGLALGGGEGWESVLTDLGSEDYTVRQQATQRLLGDEHVGLEEIEKLYAQAESPEQRQRLLAVYQHHVVRQIRQQQLPTEGAGSIGIVHGAVAAEAEVGRPAVRVAYCFAGFPGFVYLQPGDLITEVDEEQTPTGVDSGQIERWFMGHIQGHRAGERVRLKVYREGVSLNLAFDLVSSEALKKMYRSNDQSLLQPYLDQWEAAAKRLVEQGPLPSVWEVELPKTLEGDGAEAEENDVQEDGMIGGGE